MAHCTVVRLPLWAILWLQSWHFGPFYEWKPTIVARFMVVRYRYGPLYGCKVTVMGHFMVAKLPLWPILWLENYHYDPFYCSKLILLSFCGW